MLHRYALAASLLLAAVGAHAQSTITNLQATNITATTATITFSGGSATISCSPLIQRIIAGGSPVGVPYAMPLQLTGLPPATAITVQVIPQVINPLAGPQRCLTRPGATITFTTARALAVVPAAAAGALALAPNPARASATLTLPAPLPAPAAAYLLDALGREVRQWPLPAHAPTAALDLAGLLPGLYLVRVSGGTARLVVE